MAGISLAFNYALLSGLIDFDFRESDFFFPFAAYTAFFTTVLFAILFPSAYINK